MARCAGAISGRGLWFEDNTARSSATSLVNGRIGYAFDKRLRLQLDVFNLFNRKDHDIDYFLRFRLPAEPAARCQRHSFSSGGATLRPRSLMRISKAKKRQGGNPAFA